MIVARQKTQYYNWPELPGEKKRSRGKQAGHSLRWKEKLALTGLMVLFFCSSLLIAFYFAQVLATGYMLNKAEKDLAQLRKESHDLYTRVNEFSNLENVENLAVNRLGMVRPQNEQVILVQSAAPLEQAGTVAAAGALKKEEQQRAADAGDKQNWVIRAFTNMVGRLEASINTG